MTEHDAPQGGEQQDVATAATEPVTRFALVGNPNTGKTTLFNQLCGVRAETANFPGSTVEARRGRVSRADGPLEIVDLPGHYGLNLNRPESTVSREYLSGTIASVPPSQGILVIVDATNLQRNLILTSQALQQGLPVVVALNMTDLARRRGLTIDTAALSRRLGCPIIPICARSGQGIDDLVEALKRPVLSAASDLPDPTLAQDAAEWAEAVVKDVVQGNATTSNPTLTDRLDAVFTHPVLGVLTFMAVMAVVFYVIFSLATIPMDLIELLFSHVGAWIGAVLPAGAIHDLLVDGVVAGIAGTVVFLPQICLLFFLISLLEDTGYLARAALVMDRLLRRFGLPGQSFVPLLSAHACALPAIMSARLIPSLRDRLATILVAPFMSCSARLPVYVLLIGILFGDQPLLAGLAFAGCYLLGAIAALLTALIFRRTTLRGDSLPMVLELPTYKRPSLRTALLTTLDRAIIFLRKAGTVIVAICIILWWLGAYPTYDPSTDANTNTVQAVEPDDAHRAAKAHSFIGRLGRLAEPIFQPLGYDWQLSIGVLSSFAAREVFVSTMAVVLAGTEDNPAEDDTLRQRITGASRSDGTPLFTHPTTASLLVFYVLALQCLPTLAVTRRETGGWKWAMIQLVYMTAVAYVAAWVTYRSMILFGG